MFNESGLLSVFLIILTIPKALHTVVLTNALYDRQNEKICPYKTNFRRTISIKKYILLCRSHNNITKVSKQ